MNRNHDNSQVNLSRLMLRFQSFTSSKDKVKCAKQTMSEAIDYALFDFKNIVQR